MSFCSSEVVGRGADTVVGCTQILILIFAEVLGLYGLIVALIMNSAASGVDGSVVSVRVNIRLLVLNSFVVLSLILRTWTQLTPSPE